MNDKIIIKNKAKIIKKDNEVYVIKKTKKDLTKLNEYLDNRDFTSYPHILSKDNEYTKYEYIESKSHITDEKLVDLIKTVALLHYKTAYYKTVSRLKYKKIYEKLIDNVDYLKLYYEKLITDIESTIYFSPVDYLIARNYHIIKGSLDYSERTLNAWYREVNNKTKQRVVVVHNNLKQDHFIIGDIPYLINFDNYIIDSPVLDLYKLYKNEFSNYDFKDLFKIYNSIFHLEKNEIMLLNILISIPGRIEETGNNLMDTKNINEIINFIYKSNDLVTSGVFEIEENEPSK
ncbi:MAG: hypothetical protein RSB41_02990 [Bacilli bacterium]